MRKRLNSMNLAAFIGVLLAMTFIGGIASAEDNDYTAKTIEVGKFKKIKDIQTAIYQSKPGDVIVVSPGTYEDYTPKAGVTVKEAQTGTVHLVPEDSGIRDNGGGFASGGSGLGPEFQAGMSEISDLACGKGQTMGMIGAAASAVVSFFGGGKATYSGQMMQQGQLIISNACLAEQAAMQAKIIAKGKYDTQGDIRRGMRRVNKMVENVEEIPWADMYPETYGEVDQQSQIIWRNVEVKRQYDAGMTSKKTAGEAVAALNEFPDRSTGMITAAQNAEGPTAVGQAHVQATMMGVEVQSMALSNQIAHQQVVEAHLDKQTAAERRAIEYKARQRRGLPGYEGDGGLGLLMAEDK
jgi:hypothetical protein